MAVKGIAQRQIAGRVGIARRPIATSGKATTYALQPETLAYFARGNGQPSFTFFDAVNTFIFKAKAKGIWAELTAGWFFCADNQVQALQNIAGTSFTATLNASPTFTATKGFSGFDGSNGVVFGGIGSGQLTNTSVNILAANFTTGTSVGAIGTTVGDGLSWFMNASGNLQFTGLTAPVLPTNPGRQVIGGAGSAIVFGSSSLNATGALGTVNATIQTTLNIGNPLTRLSANFYGATMTTAHGRILASLVSEAIESVGALD